MAAAVVRYAGLKTALRCYHEMAMPLGLLVVGDSFMELDPLLGQVSLAWASKHKQTALWAATVAGGRIRLDLYTTGV